MLGLGKLIIREVEKIFALLPHPENMSIREILILTGAHDVKMCLQESRVEF
jgi:hypothetical protein